VQQNITISISQQGPKLQATKVSIKPQNTTPVQQIGRRRPKLKQSREARYPAKPRSR